MSHWHEHHRHEARLHASDRKLAEAVIRKLVFRKIVDIANRTYIAGSYCGILAAVVCGTGVGMQAARTWSAQFVERVTPVVWRQCLSPEGIEVD